MAEGGFIRAGGDGQEVPGDAAPPDAVRPQEQEAAGGLLGAEAEHGGCGELNRLRSIWLAQLMDLITTSETFKSYYHFCNILRI